MTGRHPLRDLLDEATAEIPPRHQAAPLAAIRRRVHRRRAARTATLCLAVLAILLAGIGTVRATTGGHHPAATSSPGPARRPGLAWLSAMVARDDRTVTVYAGVAGCRTLDQPRSTLTGWTARTATIGVDARVVHAADCTTAATAVPLVVHLPATLGSRTLRDATGATHPVYHQRELPDMTAAGWAPTPTSWAAPAAGWYQAFTGPHGTTVQLSAEPAAGHTDPWPVVTTRRLHHRTATVTGGGQLGWTASWQVGHTSYGLRFTPREGQGSTLAQFTHLLDTLRWT